MSSDYDYTGKTSRSFTWQDRQNVERNRKDDERLEKLRQERIRKDWEKRGKIKKDK